jgi:hypothetical protein
VATSSTFIDGAVADVDKINFYVFGEPTADRQRWFLNGLLQEMKRHGHTEESDVTDQLRLVLNVVDIENPTYFRRKAQGTFVAAIVETDHEPEDVIRAAYPMLLKALSNVAMYLVPRGKYTDAHFLTMEQGHYVVRQEPGQSDADYFHEIYNRLAPLATSQLVINNVFVPDLPEELWNGDEHTRALKLAGEKLDQMNLLPAPFPIHDFLNERDLRHVMRLFGMGGLSYGNLSVRRDADTFWMSASGVNKGKLNEIGRDILLVTDHDAEANAMVLSVPPNVEPRRVSVDAIEHFIIYREHPNVGAIIHIHAWIDGIDSTHINYPCGTQELALVVSELVRQAPDPSRAVVGLKNHGLTITGHSLEDIFERIEGKIIPQVPMS